MEPTLYTERFQGRGEVLPTFQVKLTPYLTLYQNQSPCSPFPWKSAMKSLGIVAD